MKSTKNNLNYKFTMVNGHTKTIPSKVREKEVRQLVYCMRVHKNGDKNIADVTCKQ